MCDVCIKIEDEGLRIEDCTCAGEIGKPDLPCPLPVLPGSPPSNWRASPIPKLPTHNLSTEEISLHKWMHMLIDGRIINHVPRRRE